MFKVGEVINTDIGEVVKIFQFLSDINGISEYMVLELNFRKRIFVL